jgi:hypothetical protein
MPDYFAKINRTMLAAVREVGAMPFLLFEYYMTYSTAPEIRPSLETIAKDLGILDKKGKPSKSAVCNLKKILIEKGWIREESGCIFLLKSFRISENHSEFLNESFRNSERPLYKDEKEKEERKDEKNEIYSAHETFSENELGLGDDAFATNVELTFQWLRQKKNLVRLPQTEWVALFTELETEGISLDGFKEFYLWVENLDWVTGTVSVKLLRGQIEAYKNREHLEAKRIIKNGANNGKNQQYSNGNKPTSPATTIINRPYRTNS